MSIEKCSACEDLRQNSPDFALNGVTEEVCESLHDNTGFNPDSGHKDEEDLHAANDCLVGNMSTEVKSYGVCDWKKFMRKFIPNLYEVLSAIICALGGLAQASYVGILTLYSSEKVTWDGTLTLDNFKVKQDPAFNTNVRQGNVPEAVLQRTSDYKGIVVNNTTEVPLLVNATFNCSIHTDQHLCSTFIVITRDGTTIGQTPFITPTTYDQQVRAEPFILEPGKSTTLKYYFEIGDANIWFKNNFGGSGTDTRCVLDKNSKTNPENQRSYFSVEVTSVIGNKEG